MIEEIVDGATTWRFDTEFLRSNWTCIFGRGCLGIADEPAEHLGLGCCSVGAELDGADEARLISARAAMLDPDRWQHHAAAATGGIFAGDDHGATRVVDGACIFLNRPGFAGGPGCALHIAALDSGESPIDWKPSVCWQLPIRVTWEPSDGGDDDAEIATVRRWSRADWGPEGDTMHWCCTEGDRAYVGATTVLDSMAEELEAIVGPAVLAELTERLQPPATGGGDDPTG